MTPLSTCVTRTLILMSVSASALATVPVGPPPPPECSVQTPQVLWPPDHKFVTVALADVKLTGQYTITITGVQQDEPVAALGSGNTGPDAVISGDGTTVQVRAERAGPGAGRIYFISFSALNMVTSSACTGVAQVWVPHDMAQATPVDTGARYDSTQP